MENIVNKSINSSEKTVSSSKIAPQTRNILGYFDPFQKLATPVNLPPPCYLHFENKGEGGKLLEILLLYNYHNLSLAELSRMVRLS